MPTEVFMTDAEELEALRVKARQVAVDFMGYPADEETALAIDNATPMQAIEALEKECTRLRSCLDELNTSLEGMNTDLARLNEAMRANVGRMLR